MDTKLLNKYLAGDALPEEKREVVRWMKESEEHREQLMQMRHIYDATIWNGNLQEKKAENKKIMMRYLWTSMKIAAVIAMIAFIIHKEYQEYRFEHSTEMQMMTVELQLYFKISGYRISCQREESDFGRRGVF